MNDKITPEHLNRPAYVYIRQSTLQQVRVNVESRKRQYGLEERARTLGFGTVVLVDDDLGVSGSGSRERPGFGRLLAAVCDGGVGAVFALEASRLARNNRDWHHLIDLCVLTRTLVIDADGVYDPGMVNDRLLLGMKGTMSEFELGMLRQRAMEAYRGKVLRGEVLTMVPVGYVRKGKNGIEMTPDLQVQEAIMGFFRRFEACGSVRQAMIWYHEENVSFPVQRRRGETEVMEWKPPHYRQLLRIVRSPVYAGAFAWGRTAARSRVVDGRSNKTSGHRVPMEEWQVLIKDHHEGYIDWEQYMSNSRLLESNRTKSHQTCSGAAREGGAVLVGLLRCRRCGHKLHVSYRGKNGRAARYYCATGKECQGESLLVSFGGVRAEDAVVESVLEACAPLGIVASLRAFENYQGERDQKRKARALALEKARFEAERAGRQYDAADPANRLVTAELERRWNTALVNVSEIENRLESESLAQRAPSEEQRARLTLLGADLHALWEDPSTPVELKKRVLRTALHEIVVDVNHRSGQIEMEIHWAGGVHTPLRVRKNQSGRNRNATGSEVVAIVAELAVGWSDREIAATLNRAGLKTGKGNTWNETRVRNLRTENRIPVHSKAPERTWKTMSEASSELGVSMCVVRTLVRSKLLPARQIAKACPWMIEGEDLRRPEVVEYARKARAGKKAPFDDGCKTLNL